MSDCPLCSSHQTAIFHQDDQRDYYRCQLCALVFVPSCYFLDAAAEKTRYDSHQNTADNIGYCNFLERLTEPLITYLKAGDCGIDYGCGPEPILSQMMQKKGFEMHHYDPYYSNHTQHLNKQYDFLTCSESIEHFYTPNNEWQQWLKMINKKGWIAIMTQLLTPQIDFSQWYYKNDPTHVCFYSTETFHWAAKKYNLKTRFINTSVVIMQR